MLTTQEKLVAVNEAKRLLEKVKQSLGEIKYSPLEDALEQVQETRILIIKLREKNEAVL